jgi:small subunit ribosomal protein S6
MADRRLYEVMFIVDPRLEDASIQQVVDRYLGVVKDQGGEIAKVDHWGRRKFAFEMQNLHEGYYVVAQCNAAAGAMNELDRVLRLADELVRHKIVRPGKD